MVTNVVVDDLTYPDCVDVEIPDVRTAKKVGSGGFESWSIKGDEIINKELATLTGQLKILKKEKQREALKREKKRDEEWLKNATDREILVKIYRMLKC